MSMLEVILKIIITVIAVLGIAVFLGICFMLLFAWVVNTTYPKYLDGTDEDDRMYYW